MLDLLEYLNQIKTLQIQIDKLTDKYNHVKGKICSPAGASYDRVRVQEPRKNLIEDNVIKLCELSERILVCSLTQAEIKHKTTGLINQLEDAHEIEFLFLRYVLLKTLADTAEEMKLTSRQIYRIKKRSINNLNEVYLKYQ